jgi:hypothetical protein
VNTACITNAISSNALANNAIEMAAGGCTDPVFRKAQTFDLKPHYLSDDTSLAV